MPVRTQALVWSTEEVMSDKVDSRHQYWTSVSEVLHVLADDSMAGDQDHIFILTEIMTDIAVDPPNREDNLAKLGRLAGSLKLDDNLKCLVHDAISLAGRIVKS
jgi:hypothetical protein